MNAVTFATWTGQRSVASIGTNSGSASIPFQDWKHFKEAFAPELVREAIESSPVPVDCSLDPFGGSGTTALASQFLGVHPITVEVNPFLADVIAAKLHHYDLNLLSRHITELIRAAENRRPTDAEPDLNRLPPSFIEPGSRNRFIFTHEAATAIMDINHAIDQVDHPAHARFLRVMLGAILLQHSNVRVSGKGRRYRANWAQLRPTRIEILSRFAQHAQASFADVARFNERRTTTYELLVGDARSTSFQEHQAQVSIFSPPYPNSFDYTDVYNVELWMLGYLRGKSDNTLLRQSTLSSHVQIGREFAIPPTGSQTLEGTMQALQQAGPNLWDRRIPDMIGAYFADLYTVLTNVKRAVRPGGRIWAVVGDSRYAGISVPVAKIVAELAPSLSLDLVEVRPFRSMRASPQNGGRLELDETLLILHRGTD